MERACGAEPTSKRLSRDGRSVAVMSVSCVQRVPECSFINSITVGTFCGST